MKKVQFTFTDGQLDRIANICEDLAKGNILAAVAVPILSNAIDTLLLVYGISAGLTFMVLAISIEGEKENL